MSEQVERYEHAVRFGERLAPGDWGRQFGDELLPEEAGLFDAAREIAELQQENERLRNIVRDAEEYLLANAPFDNLGYLDRGAGVDRKNLLNRISGLAP